MAVFLWVISQVTWWQVDYIGLLSSCKMWQFIITGIDTPDALIRYHCIPHSIASDQRSYCIANNVPIQCFKNSPSCWSTWSDRTVEWPFVTQVTVLIKWQHLVGLWKYPSGGCICYKSKSVYAQYMVLFLPLPVFKYLGIEGQKWDRHRSLSTRKLLWSSFVVLCFADQGIWALKGGMLPLGDTIVIPLSCELNLSSVRQLNLSSGLPTLWIKKQKRWHYISWHAWFSLPRVNLAELLMVVRKSMLRIWDPLEHLLWFEDGLFNLKLVMEFNPHFQVLKRVET